MRSLNDASVTPSTSTLPEHHNATDPSDRPISSNTGEASELVLHPSERDANTTLATINNLAQIVHGIQIQQQSVHDAQTTAFATLGSNLDDLRSQLAAPKHVVSPASAPSISSPIAGDVVVQLEAEQMAKIADLQGQKHNLSRDIEALLRQKDEIPQEIVNAKVEKSAAREELSAARAGGGVWRPRDADREDELLDALMEQREEAYSLRLQVEGLNRTIKAQQAKLDEAANTGHSPTKQHGKQSNNMTTPNAIPSESKGRANEIDLRRDLKTWKDKSETQRAQLHKVQTAQARYAEERRATAAPIDKLQAQVSKLSKANRDAAGVGAVEKRAMLDTITGLKAKVESSRADNLKAGRLIMDLTDQLAIARGG